MKVDEHTQLSVTDRRLVDLVGAALVDPNLHTDTRMRLQNEIAELLRTTHEQAYRSTGREPHERRPLATHDGDLSEVLESVLVDPSLHTDLRMRLHAEVEQLLRGAR